MDVIVRRHSLIDRLISSMEEGRDGQDDSIDHGLPPLLKILFTIICK